MNLENGLGFNMRKESKSHKIFETDFGFSIKKSTFATGFMATWPSG